MITYTLSALGCIIQVSKSSEKNIRLQAEVESLIIVQEKLLEQSIEKGEYVMFPDNIVEICLSVRSCIYLLDKKK